MSAPLSEQVYAQLYDAMLDHRLRPGDRLNRRQVAQDLGVSVAPVLEAMTRLEWEGFLATVPRVGTVVQSVTAADVLGRFRVRQAIEAEAARLYAGEPIRGIRGRLELLAERADAAKSGTFANHRTEVEFHSALVEAAGCKELSEAFGHVMRHSLYHAAHDFLPHVPERTMEMHQKLLASLARADADTAERLIRRHLSPLIEALAEVAKRTPSGPSSARLAARGAAVRIRRPRRGRRAAE